MGSGFRGDFGKTKGSTLAASFSNSYVLKIASSPNNNLDSLKKDYDFNSKTGKFGEKGKNSRVIKCDNPISESQNFFNIISKNGIFSDLSNGKGKRVDFTDGSTITYRVNTSIPNSPAVDINISTYENGKISSQKIHFEKR